MKHHQLDFLPAALAVQQRPPHPAARWLTGVILALLAAALVWACCGRVDIVAVAEGRVVPAARVKEIQPLDKGVIAQLLVKEGALVKPGDPLVVLDATQTLAQRERIRSELQARKDERQREQDFLAQLDNNAAITTPAAQDMQQQLLARKHEQFIAQRAALLSQLDSRRAERRVNREMISKLEQTAPLQSKRTADLRLLAQKKLVAEHQYLEQEEQRIIQLQDLAAARARDQQFAAAITEAEQQLAALAAQTRTQTLLHITETAQHIASLEEQLKQAEDANARQVLYAPVAGRVQELAVNTIGGVVMEAQRLMLVVPEEDTVEVEAWLPNRDIGFVQEGDVAAVKVHTFPFTRYGTVPATVTQVSDDAVQPDNRGGAPETLLYRMTVQLATNRMQVERREVRLLPGMQVTVEVLTGKRRIIDYFLEPLQQKSRESIRER